MSSVPETPALIISLEKRERTPPNPDTPPSSSPFFPLIPEDVFESAGCVFKHQCRRQLKMLAFIIFRRDKTKQQRDWRAGGNQMPHCPVKSSHGDYKIVLHRLRHFNQSLTDYITLWSTFFIHLWFDVLYVKEISVILCLFVSTLLQLFKSRMFYVFLLSECTDTNPNLMHCFVIKCRRNISLIIKICAWYLRLSVMLTHLEASVHI